MSKGRDEGEREGKGEGAYSIPIRYKVEANIFPFSFHLIHCLL